MKGKAQHKPSGRAAASVTRRRGAAGSVVVTVTASVRFRGLKPLRLQEKKITNLSMSDGFKGFIEASFPLWGIFAVQGAFKDPPLCADIRASTPSPRTDFHLDFNPFNHLFICFYAAFYLSVMFLFIIKSGSLSGSSTGCCSQFGSNNKHIKDLWIYALKETVDESEAFDEVDHCKLFQSVTARGFKWGRSSFASFIVPRSSQLSYGWSFLWTQWM